MTKRINLLYLKFRCCSYILNSPTHRTRRDIFPCHHHSGGRGAGALSVYRHRRYIWWPSCRLSDAIRLRLLAARIYRSTSLPEIASAAAANVRVWLPRWFALFVHSVLMRKATQSVCMCHTPHPYISIIEYTCHGSAICVYCQQQILCMCVCVCVFEV